MSVTPNPWHDFSAPEVLEGGSATLTYAEMAEEEEAPEAEDEAPDVAVMLSKALNTIDQQATLINKLLDTMV